MSKLLPTHAAVSLPWLIRLRWSALAGQLLVLTVAQKYFGAIVQWELAGAMLLVGIASNVALMRWADVHANRGIRATSSDAPSVSLASRVTGAALTLDTLLLTGILAASGAATNPFTTVYLVHIVLAALVLNRHWTSALTLLNACCFGLLFAFPAQSCHVEAGSGYAGHLYGMWLAFALAAVVIAYFVQQISRTIEAQRLQIAELAQRARESAHMASLTTLAAGAAHELRTPLSTIAVAAHELKRREQARLSTASASDLELIEAEIERCQEILWSMGPRFSGVEQATTRLLGVEVLGRLEAEFETAAGADSDALVVRPPEPAVAVACVESELMSALRGLVKNALDAVSVSGSRVEVSVANEGEMVCFRVEDDGEGMEPSTVERALEPFFTTKEPGKGLGLGLFLVNFYAQSAGGSLRLSSQLGRGTRAELRLPAHGAIA
jgi:two-component system, sensor histidine kinase RegB